MPKTNFLSWDTTANNNTDVGGVNIAEGCAPSGINNAMREIMAQLRADIDGGMVYAAKSANYTAVANDNNGYLRFTAAATLSLTAVATLGADWHVFVQADGGDVIVDPNASETINGSTTITIRNGESALIISNGSAFFARVNSTTSFAYAAKSGNYTAVAADTLAVLRFTAAATLSLTAAATLGSGWRVKVIAYNGDVTIDPNASETINGATTLILKSGQTADIVCDGTAFYADVHGDTLSGPQLQGYSFGLALTTNGSDASNDVDIATGAAASDVSPYYLMQLTSALTKQIDASWAVGTNQGGLDTGAVGNNTYYIWLIQRSDTGVVDVLFSLSSTAPTMPTNYNRKRLIGSLVRTGGVNGATAKPVSSTVPFRSQPLTITMSSVNSIAHGLGAQPSRVTAKIICTTTNQGYAVGDEVMVSSYWSASGGAFVGADTTNAWVVFPSGYAIFNKTTFGNASITAASWRLVIEAWL